MDILILNISYFNISIFIRHLGIGTQCTTTHQINQTKNGHSAQKKKSA